MAAKSASLQDHFLNAVRRSHQPVSLFVLKGVRLQGVISGFDPYSVELRRERRQPAGLQAFDRDDRPGGARRRPRAGRAGRRPARPASRTASSRPPRNREALTAVPGQWRDAAGRSRRLRPIFAAAQPRPAVPAGLQACDFDDPAGPGGAAHCPAARSRRAANEQQFRRQWRARGRARRAGAGRRPRTAAAGARRSAEARIEEAQGLAEAIGVVVAEARPFRVRTVRPATLLGKGQVEEIAEVAKAADAQAADRRRRFDPGPAEEPREREQAPRSSTEPA